MTSQEIKDKYKLSEEEHMEIYKQIEQEVFGRVAPDSKPVAIIVGAQPGAGKGSIISYSKKQMEMEGKDIVIISTDEYKPYHPNAIEMSKKYPTEYIEIVEQDAGDWTSKVMKKAIEEKYNFIFEGTLKNDRILRRIEELKENGFEVVVRTLAVSKLESLISIHERYESQIENMGWGRLVSVEHHNRAYDGIPAVIDKIEKSKLCTTEVFIRGEEISSPKKVYSSKEDSNKYISARMALEEQRNIQQRNTAITAEKRIKEIKQKFINRNAQEKEMKQLEELNELLKLEIER